MDLRFSRLLLGFLLVLGGSRMSAQTPPPATGGLAEAQREFQELKSVQAVPESSKLELPRISGPNVPAAVPAPARPTLLEREKLRQAKQNARKAKNWLVDGVMGDGKDSDESDASMDDESLDPFDRLIAEQKHAENASDDRTGDAATSSQNADPLSQAPNPLATYMADWISPRDRQLLLPTIERKAGDEGFASLLASGAPGPGPSAVSDAVAGPADFMTPKSSIGRDNPYLPASAPPPVSAPALVSSPPAKPPVGAVAPAQAAQPAPAVPVDHAKKLPEQFAKPDDDEKYFPQLKRF